MHTYKSLLHDLDRLGINPGGKLLVHSSYKSIGEAEGRGETVLDCLCEYMKDGILLLPSHTWKTTGPENPVMDVIHTPSNVGILAELFRKKPGVLRTLHPTHSVCGFGKNAAEFIYGDHRARTPVGYESVYRRLYEQKGQILLIGVGFNANTFLHGVEEWHQVPGRYTAEPMPLYVRDEHGTIHSTPMHGFTYPFPQNIFHSEEAMLAAGAASRGKFGDAACYLCDAEKLSDSLGEMIKNNALYI